MGPVLNGVNGKGKEPRQLGPQGVWVSVEDEVEVFDYTGFNKWKEEDGVEIVGSSTGLPQLQDNEVEIIDSFEWFKEKKRLAQASSFGLSRRQRLACNSISPGIISRCEHQSLGAAFIPSCQHQTCRLCLKSHLASLIEKAVETMEPSYDNLRLPLLCPNQRCELELSQRDLIDLLDIDTVKACENWLKVAYSNLYGPTRSSDMIDCIKCRQKTALISTKIACIKGKGKAKKNDSINQHKGAPIFENMQSLPRWVCTKCECSWCAACGFFFDSPRKENGRTGNHGCREATNYRIYEIIADLELLYVEYTTGAVKSSNDLPKVTYNNKHHKTVWGAGTGFGGAMHENMSFVEKVRKAEMELDAHAENVLESLTNTLKNIKSNQLQSSLGLSTRVLLSQENILSQILEYFVANDSLMDICTRSGLYHQLASLLMTMNQYPELLPMLTRSSLQVDTSGSSRDNSALGSESSVIKRMKNIYEQSKIIVNKFKDGNNDECVEANISIARYLLKCSEELFVAAGKQESSATWPKFFSVEEGSMRIKDTEAASNNISIYKESLKLLQFQEFPMIGTGLHHHTYNNSLIGLGANQQSIDITGVHNKKRMMHIAKEIASLVTSLPLEWESSIHVRVDPVRMDALKALIVGPKGTPYQNGIFIFDIYLPPDYPQVPPSVTFLTTGCGQVRFNPNLYNNGKVCLSLLGTWHNGPGWQPWKSTLLQVLVSIQSLIFVEDPYYNEPGLESMRSPAAEAENVVQRNNTLRIAILGALQNPDFCFKDVITEHFRLKKDEIENQCYEWMNTAGHPVQYSINQIACEIILELAKLSSTMLNK